MKNKVALLTFGLLLSIIVTVVFAQSKGPGFSHNPSNAAYSPYENIWIISIGISQYQNSEYNLQYADADARAMAQTFASIYTVPQNHIRVVLNADATATGIKSAFSSIQQHVGKQDGVIVYFSGHGLDYPLPSGGKMGYLVPFEGNMNDPFTTCLDMDVLRKMADLLRAKHVIFLVDSCYSGIAGTQKSTTSTAAMAEVSRMSQLPSRQLITAGRGTERALELSHLKHSAFTYWLLNGLRGQADTNRDGFVLASELFIYLNPKVKTETNNSQTPQMFALPGGQEGDFIFRLDVEREAREAAAQVSTLENELATLKQRSATAKKMKNAAQQRDIEREQLRAEAALKEAKLRADAARREKELQAKAQEEAKKRAALAEQQAASAKARTEQLQREALEMREKLKNTNANAGRTVAEGIREYRILVQNMTDLDKKYAMEYSEQIRPIDDYYNQKINKSRPATKDQFETEQEYQARKQNAEGAIEQLEIERENKKREIQNSIKSIIESQKEALRGQLQAIEQITELVPRSLITFQFGQYSAEARAFGFSFQIANGTYREPYSGSVEIPVEKAKIYAANSTLLFPEATLGMENGIPKIVSLAFYGPGDGETYRATSLKRTLYRTSCGSLIDFSTGLEWYVGPVKNLKKAPKWVSELTACGGGWRMPSKFELAYLYQEDNGGVYIDPAFGLTRSRVWAAETKGSKRWFLNFGRKLPRLPNEGWAGSNRFYSQGVPQVMAVRSHK